MHPPEARSRHPGEPPSGVALPPELAAFLQEQELCALFHASDLGTLLFVKAPTVELETLGGTFPIGLEHQLFAHPRSPVIRTLVTCHDRPETPLKLETFTNVADPDQYTHFAALGNQKELTLLFYDEALRHRLSKRLRNATGEQIPGILAEAQRLLETIPPDQVDFDAAKAAVLEVTRL